MLLTKIFCEIDDFCTVFIPIWKSKQITCGEIKRNKCSALTISEIMTILVFFHLSHYRNFKYYYLNFILGMNKNSFPNAVSYNRFVELEQSVIVPLIAFLTTKRRAKVTGISFIDSMLIRVCSNYRIRSHKVFKGIAKRAKSSVGWFFGFKLHLIINDKGELISFALTPANVDDRNPKIIKKLTKKLFGKLFGDRGYISASLFENLLIKGIQLITKIKKNMSNKLMSVFDKIVLRKRAIIESVNDELKNICSIEHSRHRSVGNFLGNIFSSLIAYSFFSKKPSLNIRYSFDLESIF